MLLFSQFTPLLSGPILREVYLRVLQTVRDRLLKFTLELQQVDTNLDSSGKSSSEISTNQVSTLVQDYILEGNTTSQMFTPIFGTPPPFSDVFPDIFVLMPFEDKLKPVYDDHISSVARALDRSCKRSDDFFSAKSIIDDIWAAIYHCKICIADCTGRNPNVFYELGIAHTVGRPTILISQSIDDIPFDIRHRRVIIYDFTPRGMEIFEETLRKTIEGELPSIKVDN